MANALKQSVDLPLKRPVKKIHPKEKLPGVFPSLWSAGVDFSSTHRLK